MRVAISGSTGFIGTALCASLRADGHQVVRLVRRRPAGPDEVRWDPAQGVLDLTDIDGVEAVVNLCGANVGARRWTRRYRRVVQDSRVRTTTMLAAALTGLSARPRVFVSASAIGYYGTDRGVAALDENDVAGDGFLARLCVEWEQAATPARAADIAVCHPRFGYIMDNSGSTFATMLPWFRLGLGGSLGGGDQVWSIASLHDTVRALRFMIEQHGCVGPYNVTAPEPVSNAELSRVLAAELNRPRLLPVPELVLRAVLGQYAEHIVGSLCVVPSRLTEAGFEFDHTDARSIVRAALAR